MIAACGGRETRGTAKIFGKTGSGPLEDGPEEMFHGWLVGWIEQDGRTLVYAMWVEAEGYEGVREHREKVVDAVFAELD